MSVSAPVTRAPTPAGGEADQVQVPQVDDHQDARDRDHDVNGPLQDGHEARPRPGAAARRTLRGAARRAAG